MLQTLWHEDDKNEFPARTETPKQMTDGMAMMDGGGSKEQKKRLQRSDLLKELSVTMTKMALRQDYV